MDIAFCKIGKSIKFDSPYSPVGGDNEAPALLRLLANNNPDKTYHIVGRSDFSKMYETKRLELFPYNNVKDAFEGKRGPADEDQVIKYFDRIKIEPDVAIFMIGQIGTVTIPNRIEQVKNRQLTAAVIEMTKNYSTPIIKWWNEKPDMKVIEIINDPRYTSKQPRDIIHNPTVSLSQYNYEYAKESIESYTKQDRVRHAIPVRYAEMERIFLFNREVPPVNVHDREVPFGIVLNEGSPSRYGMLKEWVLDNGFNDIEIYGKWEHVEAEKNPVFKGSLKLDEVHRKMRRVRSTFIIPIAHGWVTSKYVEMIHAGVVPFFHPTYDIQNHTKVPKFLRPKDPAELATRIEMLKDDETYSSIINDLRTEFCSEEYLDGTRLNDIVMKEVQPNYVRPNLTDFEISEANTLDSFFS
jgi:hypothetical protein